MSAMTYQQHFPAASRVRAPAQTTVQRRPARPAATTAAPARLTRRGRIVVVLVLAAIALVAFSLGRATTSEAARRTTAVTTPRPTTVVQPGDTLWSIARRIAPGADPRGTVERLGDLNDLGGRPIQAGQRLTLPYPG